jgi:acyl carrier protein
MSTSIEMGLVTALVAGAVLAILHLRRIVAMERAEPPGLAPRVRRVLAETLQVDPDRVRPEATLVDDLGLRARDLPGLAAALEDECALIVPERVLRGARTYQDLLYALLTLSGDTDCPQPPFVRARLVGAGPDDVRYVGWLTPATARSLAERASKAGPGAALDVQVIEHADGEEIDWVADQFAWLGELGIRVGVGVGRPLAV